MSCSLRRRSIAAVALLTWALIVTLPLQGQAQAAQGGEELWLLGLPTAYTLEGGRSQVGLNPLPAMLFGSDVWSYLGLAAITLYGAYGITDRVQLSSYPIGFLAALNAQLRVRVLSNARSGRDLALLSNLWVSHTLWLMGLSNVSLTAGGVFSQRISPSLTGHLGVSFSWLSLELPIGAQGQGLLTLGGLGIRPYAVLAWEISPIVKAILAVPGLQLRAGVRVRTGIFGAEFGVGYPLYVALHLFLRY